MKELKELGLSSIEAEQAQEINGGYYDPIKDIICCLVDIPPMDINKILRPWEILNVNR